MLLQKSMMAMQVPERIANAIPKHIEEERDLLEEKMLRDVLKVSHHDTAVVQYLRSSPSHVGPWLALEASQGQIGHAMASTGDSDGCPSTGRGPA